MRRIPWHPTLLALAWVLSAYVSASPSPYAVIRPLVAAMVLALLLTLFGRLVLGQWHRGGLLATAAVAVLTFGRDITTVCGNILRALPPWQSAILVGVLLLALPAAAFLMRAHLQRVGLAARLGSALTVFTVLLVLVIVLGGVTRGTLALGDLQQGSTNSQIDRSPVQRTGPDIYVLILDGYPRADVLRDRHGIDTSDFLEELRLRGFTVDRASHSNYLLTQLTLTSMLHMSLLPDISGVAGLTGGDAPDQPTARRVLNTNPTFDFLRERGYLVVTYAIPYENPALRQSDVLVELGGLNELERQLVMSSFVLELWSLVQKDPIADDMRSQIRLSLDQISRIAEDRRLGPRVLFAHVLAPHTPFLFDASGEPITSGLDRRQEDLVEPGALTEEEYSSLLEGQVQFVNHAVLAAIDSILAASPEPPVVIVMSDHGARTTQDAEPTTPAESREAFGTLFAALTPGREDVFPAGVTPSQVMASLLNSYFGADLPLASTQTFASPGSAPFDLTPVPQPQPPPSGD